MPKFKVGDEIISAKGGVRKVIGVNANSKLYDLEVVTSKTLQVGSIYSFDIDRTDAAYAIKTPARNSGTMFKHGEEIVSKIQPLFRCKVIATDFAKFEYCLEVTRTTIGFAAVTSKLWESFMKIESEFKTYNPVLTNGIVKPLFDIGNKLKSRLNGKEVTVSNVDITRQEYTLDIVATKTSGYSLGYTFHEVHTMFDLVTNTNNLYKREYQVSFETKTSCECGAHKLGYTNPGRSHSSWCKLYKE